MYGDADYSKIDPLINKWAQDHKIKFDLEAKGYAVRSFWLHVDGERKVQLWIDAPDVEGYSRINIAELDVSLPSKWGRSLKWRTTTNELPACLDVVWKIAQTWAFNALVATP